MNQTASQDLSNITDVPPDEMLFRRQHNQARSRYRILQGLSVVAGVLILIWVAQKPLTLTAPQNPADVDLASALIPILAAAISINLFIEMGISYFEQNDRTLIAYKGRGVRWLHQAEMEVAQARQWQAEVFHHYSDEMKSSGWIIRAVRSEEDPEKIIGLGSVRIKAALDLLELARDRLNKADELLESLVDYSPYRRFKSSVANYYSILLGVLVATAASMQVFATMGVQLSNPRMDMLLTGLFIGGLVTPVHHVIANIWDILTKLVKK